MKEKGPEELSLRPHYLVRYSMQTVYPYSAIVVQQALLYCILQVQKLTTYNERDVPYSHEIVPYSHERLYPTAMRDVYYSHERCKLQQFNCEIFCSASR